MWTVKNSLRKKNYWSLRALHLIYAPFPLPWNFSNPRKNALFTPKPSENSPYESNNVNKFLLFCFLPSENLAINLTTLTNFCFFGNSPLKTWYSVLRPSEIPCFCFPVQKISSTGSGGGGGYIKWNGAVSWLVRFVCNVNFTAPHSLLTLRN